MSPLLQQLVEALGLVLASAITLAFTRLGMALRAKVKNETALTALNQLAHLAEVAVLEVEQTIVAELRAAAADGVITADEAAQAKAQAMTKVKQGLSDRGVKGVMAALGYRDEGELDQMIATHVEAAVVRARNVVGVKLKEVLEAEPKI